MMFKKLIVLTLQPIMESQVGAILQDNMNSTYRN